MPNDRPGHERSIAEVFAAAAAAIARSDDLEDALAETLGLAGELSGAGSGAIYVLDADHDQLEITVMFGLAGEPAPDAGSIESVAESRDPMAAAVRARAPQQIGDASHVALLRGSKSALLLPLVVRREGIELCLGVMALGFSGPLPGTAALAGPEPLADLAAVAVERALAVSLDSERAEWFDRLAHTDPLTGLANRRTFDRMLELEVARAGRQGVPLAITLFEVDRLDQIQRAGGNAAGDGVLRRVAQVLAGSVRLVDTIARYDASRFILVAPGPDGHVVTDRLVRAIASLPDVEGRAVSVSAGIVSFPVDGRAPEELLERADAALQVAREAGGGKVVARVEAAE